MVEGTGAVVSEALERLSRHFVPKLGKTPRREELEQCMCFLAAIWNGMVIYEGLGEWEPIRAVIRQVDAMPEPAKTETGALFLRIVEDWLNEHRGASWVYRGVHVIAGGDGQLHIRAECLALREWVRSAEPLRMGLPD